MKFELLKENFDKFLNESFEGFGNKVNTNVWKNAPSVKEDAGGVKYRAEVAGVKENKWSTNAKEYDTPEEAKQWLDSLSQRWFGYDLSRVVPTTTPHGQPVDLQNDDIYQNFRK